MPDQSDLPDVIEVVGEVDTSPTTEVPRPDLSNVQPPLAERFDLPRAQEETRAELARFVLRIQIGILIAIGVLVTFTEIRSTFKKDDSSPKDNLVQLGTTNSFIYVVKDKGETNDNKEILTLVWTAQVALVSGALGFYFGSKESSSS